MIFGHSNVMGKLLIANKWTKQIILQPVSIIKALFSNYLLYSEICSIFVFCFLCEYFHRFYSVSSKNEYSLSTSILVFIRILIWHVLSLSPLRNPWILPQIEKSKSVLHVHVCLQHRIWTRYQPKVACVCNEWSPKMVRAGWF